MEKNEDKMLDVFIWPDRYPLVKSFTLGRYRILPYQRRYSGRYVGAMSVAVEQAEQQESYMRA